MESNYLYFKCQCINIDHKKIPLRLPEEGLCCILTNYMKYVKVRNFINDLDEKYLNRIKRYIKYPQNNINIKLTYVDGDGCTNNDCETLKLKIVSKRVHCGDIQKYIEFSCCTEFVDFINLHVYNDNFEKEIKQATGVCKTLKLTNF
ncbi:hypothetical protein QKT26_gp14 [Carcinus maenas nudivirus]|uniref:Uncharacterized protein n=1 Tax=Carcinus maenas nudivirus TaxID=2880837 RepID=A0AAE9BYT5_9VIRU|nr:hypothetical protein QKT26_gp14 [Carcinus maenas nudivirus]UBZ25604.1 hypothetical protein CmNV_014 [Carcinus maenas nudivirus]